MLARALVAGAAALAPPAGLSATPPALPAWAVDPPGRVALGQRVYATECASCHGAHLEGQPDWQHVGANGMLPAPPHDATGHTWQHSDAELHDLIAHSVAAYAPPGYRTAMPAYGGVLSPRKIRAVIAYLKSTWPAGIRAYQAAQNPGGPSLAELRDIPRFPPTCAVHTAATKPLSPAD